MGSSRGRDLQVNPSGSPRGLLPQLMDFGSWPRALRVKDVLVPSAQQ